MPRRSQRGWWRDPERLRAMRAREARLEPVVPAGDALRSRDGVLQNPASGDLRARQRQQETLELQTGGLQREPKPSE
jgi:hypothetical protein